MAPPAPAPSPGGKLGGMKSMPKWMWIVAIGGGLAVGFLLLKKSPAQGEGGGDKGGAAGDGSAGGGSPVIATPLPDSLAQAFGLKPPSGSGGEQAGGAGGGDDSGGSGSDTSGMPNASGYYGNLLGGSVLSAAQTTYQGSSLGASNPAAATPYYGGAVGAVVSSPSSPSVPSGSSNFKAM